MKLVIIMLIIVAQFACIECRAQVLVTRQPAIEITKLESNNLYRFSIYNNLDSVLCILTSIAGLYRIDNIDTIVVQNRGEKPLIYKLDYLLSDSRIEPYLPVKGKICILPYQQKTFDFYISEIEPDMIFTITYFFTKKLDYPKSFKEVTKPMWFRKYELSTINSPIPL